MNTPCRPVITGQEMTISMLPILCLLAGSLAVLLSIVAGILECSRRKYNVSNEVTHISFSNNLDLNPSKIFVHFLQAVSVWVRAHTRTRAGAAHSVRSACVDLVLAVRAMCV